MNQFMIVCGIVAAAFLAYQRLKPAAVPPPPPPPPAILSEPAPVINEAEQAKILRSVEDADPDVRWEAALLLDNMKSAQAMPVLFHLMRKDLDKSVRLKAVELLGEKKGVDVLNALVGALKDQEPDVRVAALKSMERIGDYSVAGVIATGSVMKDQEESVRLQALKTLNTLQDKKQAAIEAARVRYEQEKAAAAEKR